MKKNVLKVLTTVFILSFLLVIAGCNDKNNLSDLKQQAINEVERYVNEEDYSAENVIVIKGIIAEAKVDIYEAKTSKDIDAIVLKAKADLDKVENNAGVLEEHKSKLVKQLEAYGDETNYSAEKWLELQELITTKKTVINNATTIALANQAFNQAMAELNKVYNLDVEYAKNRLSTVEIPKRTTEDFTIIETEVGSEYLVNWTVIQGTGITLEGTTASVIRTFEDSDVIIKVSFLKNQNVVYQEEFIVTIVKKEEVLANVSDLKDYKVGESVLVTGVVVGTTHNGNIGGEEVIIKDLETFAYIGVRKLPGTFPVYTVKKGDIIELAGFLKSSLTVGELDKVYLEYDERLTIKSQNNLITFDLENALEVANQADLVNLITAGPSYQFIKITTNIYSNKYGSDYNTYYNRFTLDKDNNSLAKIQIDGKTAVIRNSHSSNNIGSGWTDLMFGLNEENYAKTPAAFPGIEYKGEVYLMYTGGNSYYHQFVILDIEHIIPAIDETLVEAKEEAVINLNEHVDSLVETNYTNENWSLITNELLSEGLEAINNAKTLKEVENALNKAKSLINNVEVIVSVTYDVEFVLPTKTIYRANEELDLTGGKIIFKLDGVVEHETELSTHLITGFDTSSLTEELVLTITYTFSGKEYTSSFLIDVVAYDVSEVKDATVGTESIFRGLVIGTGHNGNVGGDEVIIKDLETFEYIGIRKMPNGYQNYDVSKGDIIEFRATVVEATTKAEIGKKVLSYISDLKVVSSNNEVLFDLDNALKINNQSEIENLVNSDNYYKFVKITTSIYSNKYGTAYDTYNNRFTLDPNNNTLESIRINGLTLALKNDYSKNNIGQDWTDLMFGINAENFGDVKATYPGIEYEGEVYVLFLGGNAYYYQFIIFEMEHILPTPGKKLNEAKAAAVVELGEYLLSFDESNYTKENWEVLNGSAFDSALLLIDGANTVEEVASLLEEAKGVLRNVESIIVYDVELVTPNKVKYFVNEELDLSGGKMVFKLNGEVVFEVELVLEMVTGFTSEQETVKLELNIEYLYAGETYTLTFNVSVVKRPPVNVSEVKDFSVGTELVFTGLVVGTTGNGNNNGLEIIIKDLVTFEYIGVRSMPGTFPAYTVSKGDIIEFNGTIVKSATANEIGKVHLSYLSDLVIASSDNEVVFDLENVIKIANQDDLINLINDGPSYQFIKITTNMYSNKYGATHSTYYNRFTLDPNNSNYDSIKVNGLPPVLRNNYVSNNIGEGWTDLMFGINEENHEDIAGTYPGIEYKGEVYLMYTGGNAYYHQFVILDIEHIIPAEVDPLTEAKQAAVASLNEHLGTLVKENYTEENWDLINGELLTNGLLAINESETVEGVEQALLEAVQAFNEVDKI